MELYIPAVAAAMVAAFAKYNRNRSAIFWFLGTMLAVFIGEIPIRMVLMGSGISADAKTMTVTFVICGIAFALACGSSRKPSPPTDEHLAR